MARTLSKREITNKYTLTKTVLGQGAFGKVILAENKNDPSQRCAVKVLSKKELGKLVETLRKEIGFIKKLDSPNIVKYYETYEDDENVYIVMEYCSGG